MNLSIWPNRRKGPARTAPNELIYAIGDIHGEYDLFVELMKKIEDNKQRYADSGVVTRIIILGDFIDRGIDSNRVFEVLFLASQMLKDFVVLAGNHEATLIKALSNPEAVQYWLDIGGWETLESYDVDPAYYQNSPEKLKDFAQQVIGPDRIEWLRTLPTSARSGGYFFCHAGVKPGVPLDKQDPAHMMWIREEFTKSDSDHGAVVVHGHTITRSPVVRKNRIGLDTGAFRTGRLCAAAFKDDELMLIT